MLRVDQDNRILARDINDTEPLRTKRDLRLFVKERWRARATFNPLSLKRSHLPRLCAITAQRYAY
ncbi:hypothetical protein A6R70_15935 [Agrobacterium rubi]|nr:hypothetical protein [Agrobacterium rubi]